MLVGKKVPNKPIFCISFANLSRTERTLTLKKGLQFEFKFSTMSFHACPLSLEPCLCMYGSANKISHAKDLSCIGFQMKSSRLSCASRSVPISAACSLFIVVILSKCQRFTRSRLFEICGKFRHVQKHNLAPRPTIG